MTDDSLQLESYQPKPLTYEDISPATFLGAVGGPIALYIQTLLINSGSPYASWLEGGLRFISGTSDTLAESGSAAYKTVRNNRRNYANRLGPPFYYAMGKLSGAALFSWLPDVISRKSGIDVHTPSTGYVAAFYGNADQLGVPIAMLLYHTNEYRKIGHDTMESLKKGAIETIKDPVALTSMGILAGSILIDSLFVRTYWTPNNYVGYWLETWGLSLLCILPVIAGMIAERKQKQKK